MYTSQACVVLVFWSVIPHFAQANQDWILIVIIGMVVGVDIVLLLLGSSIPQTRLNATLVVDEENPTSVNVSFTPSDSFLAYSTLLYTCPYNYVHVCLVCINTYVCLPTL